VWAFFGNHNEVDRSPTEYIDLFLRPVAMTYYALFMCWVLVASSFYCHDPKTPLGAFFLCALGGSLAGNSFSTKAAVELAVEPGFYKDATFYLFAFISLANAVLSLYLLAVSLRSFEALYMITVYQGYFILSGALSGNFVMDDKAGQSWTALGLYTFSIAVILVGLGTLCRGELTARKPPQGQGAAML